MAPTATLAENTSRTSTFRDTFSRVAKIATHLPMPRLRGERQSAIDGNFEQLLGIAQNHSVTPEMIAIVHDVMKRELNTSLYERARGRLLKAIAENPKTPSKVLDDVKRGAMLRLNPFPTIAFDRRMLREDPWKRQNDLLILKAIRDREERDAEEALFPNSAAGNGNGSK